MIVLPLFFLLSFFITILLLRCPDILALLKGYTFCEFAFQGGGRMRPPPLRTLQRDKEVVIRKKEYGKIGKHMYFLPSDQEVVTNFI